MGTVWENVKRRLAERRDRRYPPRYIMEELEDMMDDALEVSDRVVYRRPSWDESVAKGVRRGVVVSRVKEHQSVNVPSWIAGYLYGVKWDDDPSYVSHGHMRPGLSREGVSDEPKGAA